MKPKYRCDLREPLLIKEFHLIKIEFILCQSLEYRTRFENVNHHLEVYKLSVYQNVARQNKSIENTHAPKSVFELVLNKSETAFFIKHSAIPLDSSRIVPLPTVTTCSTAIGIAIVWHMHRSRLCS